MTGIIPVKWAFVKLSVVVKGAIWDKLLLAYYSSNYFGYSRFTLLNNELICTTARFFSHYIVIDSLELIKNISSDLQKATSNYFIQFLCNTLPLYTGVTFISN